MMSLTQALHNRQCDEALAGLQHKPARFKAVPGAGFSHVQMLLEYLVKDGLVQVALVRRGWFVFSRLYWEYRLA